MNTKYTNYLQYLTEWIPVEKGMGTIMVTDMVTGMDMGMGMATAITRKGIQKNLPL